MFRYIVIEGMDGCGKTTLAKALKTELGGIFLYEPYGETPVTKGLREYALQKDYKEEVNAEAREYMMLANRAISTELVKRNLEETDSTIIQDRSAISGMVYAKVASDYDFNEWWALAEKAFKVLPDVVVHVTASTQKINVVKGDIYDEAEDSFHTRIRSTFPHVCEWFLENKGVPFFNFVNDFNSTPEENATRLVEELCEFKKFLDEK